MCHENVAAAKFAVLADLQWLSLSADGVCGGHRKRKRSGLQQRDIALGIHHGAPSGSCRHPWIAAATMADKKGENVLSHVPLVERQSIGLEANDP